MIFTGACKLLFRQAKKHDMTYLIITCDPTNKASSRTCELAGGAYIETTAIPEDNEMYEEGKREVMIYRFEIASASCGRNETGGALPRSGQKQPGHLR